MTEEGRFLRRVEFKISDGKTEEFQRIWREEVKAALSGVAGLRRVYLIKPHSKANIFVGLTLWNSEEDAKKFEASDSLKNNRGKYSHTLAEPPVASYFTVLEHVVGNGSR